LLRQRLAFGDVAGNDNDLARLTVLVPHHAPIHFDPDEVPILMRPALRPRGVVDSRLGRFRGCSTRDQTVRLVYKVKDYLANEFFRFIAKLPPNRGRDVEDLACRRHAEDGVNGLLNKAAKDGVVAGHEQSSDDFIGYLGKGVSGLRSLHCPAESFGGLAKAQPRGRSNARPGRSAVQVSRLETAAVAKWRPGVPHFRVNCGHGRNPC